MKRIEAFVPADKLQAVADALDGKVGGFLALEGKGRGSGARPTVRMARGTGTMKAEYNKIVSVVTVVDDAQATEAIDAISGAVHTGTSGDGIILVSAVDDAVNIATKKKGSQAL